MFYFIANLFTKLKRSHYFGRSGKPLILFIACFLFFFKGWCQSNFVVNTKEIKLHSKASARSTIIGNAVYGDTVFVNYPSGSWLNVSLKDSKQGFIPNKFLTPLTDIVTVKANEINTHVGVDMSSWDFNFLFSVTFKYFLLLTACILLALLLTHYLK